MDRFPNLFAEISKVAIPKFQADDHMVWQSSDSGNLYLKGAYELLCQQHNQVSWGKIIWNPSIHPSRSFIIWMLLNGKMLTDQNLKIRGCAMASVCNLFYKAEESSHHLFLNCDFAKVIWQWFSYKVKQAIDLSSLETIFRILQCQWSKQVHHVLLAGIIHVIWSIWLCRNKNIFQDKSISSILFMQQFLQMYVW